MKIKPHPYKIANLVIVYILFFSAIVYISFNNNYQQSQTELKNFYLAEFINCSITDILEKPYTGGRGTYKLFSTNCSTNYYPIWPRPYEESALDLFQEGSIISKSPESTELTIATDSKEILIQLEHYENEDSRPLTLKIIGVLLIILTVSIFLVPNSRYEKIAHNTR